MTRPPDDDRNQDDLDLDPETITDLEADDSDSIRGGRMPEQNPSISCVTHCNPECL